MALQCKTTSFLSYLMVAGIVVGGCSNRPPEQDQASVQEAMLSPLEKLFPAQRMPNEYSRIHQAAHILVELEQNADAVSGQMSLTINAARESDCEEVTDGLQPWFYLCLKSVTDAAPLSLTAEAVIHRVSVGASVMGAYASLDIEGESDGLHLVIKPTDFGGWELRPRPSSDIELGPYVPALSLETGPSARSEQTNSEMLILEARIKR